MFRKPDEDSSRVDFSDESHVLDASLGPSSGRANFEPHVNRPEGTGKAIAKVASPLNELQLPLLDSSQLHALLYVSMLEERCRKEATAALKERRGTNEAISELDEELETVASEIFAQMSLDVRQTSTLPREVFGPHGSEIRKAYLASIDGGLRTTATQVLQNPTSQATAAVTNELKFGRLGFMPLGVAGSSPLGGSIIARTRSATSSLLTHGHDTGGYDGSQYEEQFMELNLLGKGGYGKVYRVRHKLDNQEYAVKKIVLSSKRLQHVRDEAQSNALLAEVRTLAKLVHTNVVRYFSSWLEFATDSPTSVDVIPSTSRHVRQHLLEAPLMTTESTSKITETSDSFEFDNCKTDEVHDLSGSSDVVPTREEYADDDIFGFDSESKDENWRSPRARRASQLSHATMSSTNTATRTAMVTVGEDEDEDVEIIPHVPGETSAAEVEVSEGPRRGRNVHSYPERDMIMFIKMSLHPMTLSTFISPDPSPGSDGIQTHRHCFHPEITVGILNAILDGIEYLHGQRIIHRDLKPGNIFLSVHTDHRPSSEGCVNITACQRCKSECEWPSGQETKPVYITPCIGDFGLIAELKDATQTNFSASPLSQLQPKPVGTQFYRPTQIPLHEPKICPKLDIYSLGIIAFELAYQFGTKAERAILLTDLGRGKVPKDFEGHALQRGILKMVSVDRDQRWNCGDVRDWLAGLKQRV
jgi:translation initiation factor 2-alpha kinase 3